MAFPRIGGAGAANLGIGPLAYTSIGGPTALTNAVTLQAGQVWEFPSGTYMVFPGAYTFLQQFDPVARIWRNMPTITGLNFTIDSDGDNFRLANTTGCVVGALITTGGAGLTNGIGLGASVTGITAISCTGGAVFSPVVGGSVATSGSPLMTATGSNYLFPPLAIFDAPPAGGIQATGIVNLSGAFGLSITMTNQGAGYTTAPRVTIVNDPRDTTGTGMAFTTTIATASASLTALLVTDHGNPVTTTPTISFTSSASTAPTAVPVMNYVVTGYTSSTGGDNIVGSGLIAMSSQMITSGTGSLAVGNPAYDTKITFPRPARITAFTSGTGVLQGSTGGTVAPLLEDQGLGIQKVPRIIFSYNQTATGSFSPAATATVGGVTDTSFITPM